MDTKPWWQSKTIWGAIIGGVAAVLKIFHINVELPADLADQILSCTTLVGTILALIGLRTATKPISSDPAGSNQVGGGMRMIGLLMIPAILFSSCETLPANATPQQKAQAAINSATTGVKLVVGPAVTAWLLWQKDPIKQQKDAAMVYAAATALNAAATGATPTPAELQAWIVTFFGPHPDQRYVQLASLLASEYSAIYSLFAIAGTSPVKFFVAVALEAQNAARPFLALTKTADQKRIEQNARQLIAAFLFYYDFSAKLTIGYQTARG